MAEEKTATEHAEFHVTPEQAHSIACLLRYVVSLNTTVGLVSPTQRRIAPPTYRAVELAALVFEGKTFEEAAQEAETAWRGSLEENFDHALDILKSNREALQNAMSTFMRPEQFAEYLEISEQPFLEIVRSEVLNPVNNPMNIGKK
jgi:predicted RNase H-like HicB family nuclease